LQVSRLYPEVRFIASPGWVTFRDCDSSENLSGWQDVHHQILEYDFKTLVSGHVSKLGTREDVLEGIEYIDDLVPYAREAHDPHSPLC